MYKTILEFFLELVHVMSKENKQGYLNKIYILKTSFGLDTNVCSKKKFILVSFDIDLYNSKTSVSEYEFLKTVDIFSSFKRFFLQADAISHLRHFLHFPLPCPTQPTIYLHFHFDK